MQYVKQVKKTVLLKVIIASYEYDYVVSRTGKLWTLAIEWVDGVSYGIQRAGKPSKKVSG